MAPRELLVPEGVQPPPRTLVEGVRLVRQPVSIFELKRATDRVLSAQGVREAGALGLAGHNEIMRAIDALREIGVVTISQA